MSDELLLQNILDRLTAMDEKIDNIKEGIHAQNVNEAEQNGRLERIEQRMGSFETFQQTVTVQLDELTKACSPAVGDDEEIAQGVTAALRKVLRDPKVLWPILLLLAATGVIKSDVFKQFLGIATPAAVVAPEVIQ